MRSRIGIVEHGHNRGPEIDRWNEAAGVPPGSAYCATCVSDALRHAGAVTPKTSALALGLRDKSTFKARDVLSGKKNVEVGDLAIWRSGDTWRGHVETVERVLSRTRLQTIGANTSPPSPVGGRGDQRDGDGVWRRIRTIDPYSYFGIKYFTRPAYPSWATSELGSVYSGQYSFFS